MPLSKYSRSSFHIFLKRLYFFLTPLHILVAVQTSTPFSHHSLPPPPTLLGLAHLLEPHFDLRTTHQSRTSLTSFARLYLPASPPLFPPFILGANDQKHRVFKSCLRYQLPILSPPFIHISPPPNPSAPFCISTFLYPSLFLP